MRLCLRTVSCRAVNCRFPTGRDTSKAQFTTGLDTLNSNRKQDPVASGKVCANTLALYDNVASLQRLTHYNANYSKKVKSSLYTQ